MTWPPSASPAGTREGAIYQPMYKETFKLYSREMKDLDAFQEASGTGRLKRAKTGLLKSTMLLGTVALSEAIL